MHRLINKLKRVDTGDSWDKVAQYYYLPLLVQKKIQK